MPTAPATASRRPRPALSASASRLLLIGAAVAIALVDAAFALFSLPLGVVGLMDELAHAATTVLVLAVLPRRSRPFVIGALLAAVLIDLDHIPQYVGTNVLTAGTPRPYPHCLLTLLIVGVLAWRCSGWRRQLAAGAVLGLAVHLVRDMAERDGHTGVALLWPLSDDSFAIPYAAYAGGLAVVLGWALWRRRPARGDARGHLLERARRDIN